MKHDIPFWLRGFCFAPDDGGGTGGKANTKPTDDSADETDDQDDAENAGSDDEGKGGKKPVPEKTFTQAELDQHIADRLKRERDKREKDQKAELTEAQKKKLKDSKSFEELTDVQAGEIATLTADKTTAETERDAAKTELEAANKAIGTYVESLKAGHPDSVLKLLAKQPLADQLEWLLENKPAPSDDDAGTIKPLTKKIPPTGKSDKAKPPSDNELEDARNTSARSMISNF